jgi:hypothetical protein
LIQARLLAEVGGLGFFRDDEDSVRLLILLVDGLVNEDDVLSAVQKRA